MCIPENACATTGQCWEHSEDAPCSYCGKTPCFVLTDVGQFCDDACGLGFILGGGPKKPVSEV